MAITENSFTAEELGAAMTANPAMAAQIKTWATGSGHAFRTQAEETSFLTNYERTKVDAATSQFANKLEADILEATGVPKLENEKYYDYNKRVLGTNKTALAAMKTELEALKNDPHNSTADKQRIKQLEDAIQTEKTGAGEKLTAKDKVIFELKSGFEIEKAMSKIRPKYVLGLPEVAITATESAIIGKLMGSLKEIEGKLLIMDADGKPELNKQTYQPVTLEERLNEMLVDIIDKGRQQGGAGSNQQQQQQQQNQQVEGVVKNDKGEITDVTIIPETVKTKVQLHEFLLKLGLTESSDVFNKIYMASKLPLR